MGINLGECSPQKNGVYYPSVLYEGGKHDRFQYLTFMIKAGESVLMLQSVFILPLAAILVLFTLFLAGRGNVVLAISSLSYQLSYPYSSPK